MRNALKRKLKSQRGASMLLALMFLLICMMVTSSILVASVSNAAKHRSNMEQHQQYMTISSAISAICDELNRSEYRGQYTYSKDPVVVGTTDDGTPIIEWHYSFIRKPGQYTSPFCKGGTDNTKCLKSIMLKDLDLLFGNQVERQKGILAPDGILVKFEPKGGTPQAVHKLTVNSNSGIEKLDQKVDIDLKVNSDSSEYIIELVATLGDYKMQAELTPKTEKPTLKNPTPQGDAIQQTEPLQWEISWIAPAQKEEAKP